MLQRYLRLVLPVLALVAGTAFFWALDSAVRDDRLANDRNAQILARLVEAEELKLKAGQQDLALAETAHVDAAALCAAGVRAGLNGTLSLARPDGTLLAHCEYGVAKAPAESRAAAAVIGDLLARHATTLPASGSRGFVHTSTYTLAGDRTYFAILSNFHGQLTAASGGGLAFLVSLTNAERRILGPSQSAIELPGLRLVIGGRPTGSEAMGLQLHDLQGRPAAYFTWERSGAAVRRFLAILPFSLILMLGAGWLIVRSLRKVRVLHEALEKRERQAWHAAYHDSLTGAANRRWLFDHGPELCRTGKPGGWALAIADVDRFKQVNDTLGHAFGDAMLTEIAGRLKQATAPEGFVVRIAGDEFVVVFAGGRAEVAAALDRLGRAMSVPVLHGGQAFATTLSIGVVHVPGAGADLESLLKEADDALYAAKRNGRARYEFAAQEPRSRPAAAKEFEDACLVS
jgi:diguanylate cyclase (GGDEF)-like protein